MLINLTLFLGDRTALSPTSGRGWFHGVDRLSGRSESRDWAGEESADGARVTSGIVAAAERLRTAARTAEPCEPVRDLISGGGEAYQVQRLLTESALAAGRRITGGPPGVPVGPPDCTMFPYVSEFPTTEGQGVELTDRVAPGDGSEPRGGRCGGRRSGRGGLRRCPRGALDRLLARQVTEAEPGATHPPLHLVTGSPVEAAAAAAAWNG
ncbi:hypothetical protein ACL02T_23760 [Pseudonocardia sp. RS010]|uniref:hypothetical protein n=1 Tax=Pseudonocardia sp. RS010 TaxID=3385979 RepID=UPI0039A23AD7